MGKTEYVNWNDYRKLINFLRGVGYQRESDMLKKLVRVGVALDRGDYPLAANRLSELPQKSRVGGAE